MKNLQLNRISTHGLNIEQIRSEFPMLSHEMNGKRLIYFDSASTTHKPKRVLDRLHRFYSEEYAKPNEAHSLSKEATRQVEGSRQKMADFIGAKKPEEIIFSRGCTESLNIVAGGFERGLLQQGDEVLITALEHHANIVPWQMACEQTGAKLKVAPVNNKGEIDLDAYQQLLSGKTRIVAITHSSNAIGTMVPVKKMAALAHEKNIPVLVDGAQTAPHMPVDVQDLDCDFYTFSGHKMGMPSGVGLLYGKKKWLDKLPPNEGGGDMATKVSFESYKLAGIPKKLEAGTMPFAEIIALGTLVDFLNETDMRKTEAYEQELLAYATEKLNGIDRVKIIGAAAEKEPIISFELEGLKVEKLESFLNDEYNLMVRTGDMTAQPLMHALGVKSLLRASLCYYNTQEEVDTFVLAVEDFVRHKGMKRP
jgi:cysteine desulfurase/selenocysteine lyase